MGFRVCHRTAISELDDEERARNNIALVRQGNSHGHMSRSLGEDINNGEKFTHGGNFSPLFLKLRLVIKLVMELYMGYFSYTILPLYS
jgi:hypothetical protein